MLNMRPQLLNITRKLREKILRKPTQVVLETTNACNLNCPYCMVGMQNELTAKFGTAAHSLMTRPFGFMSSETFNIIHKELKKFGIKKVYLHFQGEPLLNKLTPQFANELKKDCFEVGIFTNGQAFNDDNIAELVEAEIDLIRFSVDGASEETYQENRVGGRFDQVYENMRKVTFAHQGKRTRIEWQFLILRNNEGEIEIARKLAQEIGVHFFTKGYRESVPEFVPQNPDYRATYHKKPCKDIYHQIGIYWNGDVVPCCYDVDGSEIMGDLNENDLVSIWNSEKYKGFRNSVNNFLKVSENEPQICRNCLRWK
ncbi:MAG: radical SAM/SPASM domain-containing protein [Candidatus Scalindua sp.]